MEKKLLIFGIGGFVGPYLAREFQQYGYKVYGSDIELKEIDGVDFRQANILEAENVERLVADVKPDMIINLASISSVGASWGIPQTTIAVNVIGALNILEATRKFNINTRLMLIGSSEEYEESNEPISEETPLNANNPYGISKMTQERFAKVYHERYGMRIYCVRSFNHTGIGQKDTFVLPSFCKQVAEIEKSGKPGTIKVGNLAVERDFSDVRDVVRAYRMIIESNHCTTIFNVGSGKTYSLMELLKYIISINKQTINIETDPTRFRPFENSRICCDNSCIKTTLGWEPEYSIYDTLRDMLDFYRR